jgi:hypothetical protein
MDQDKVQDVQMTSPHDAAPVSPLEVGTKVYVRDRYLGQWSSGFVVAAVVEGGYRVRRLSDDQVFADVFPFDDVRLERRQHPQRGIGESSLDRRRHDR